MTPFIAGTSPVGVLRRGARHSAHFMVHVIESLGLPMDGRIVTARKALNFVPVSKRPQADSLNGAQVCAARNSSYLLVSHER